VALIDFGVSRRYFQNADFDTSNLGTRKYSPPEQYGFSQTDCRADIHALGVLLRFMLTGSPDGEIQSKRLGRIAGKCEAFSPNDRYQSADAVKRALIRYKISRNSKSKVFFAAAMACLAFVAGLVVGGSGSFLFPPKDSPGGADYAFNDPLVEKAVRAVLGKTLNESVSGDDLKTVAGLYFVGLTMAARGTAACGFKRCTGHEELERYLYHWPAHCGYNPACGLRMADAGAFCEML
jgi:hypothetical protein